MPEEEWTFDKMDTVLQSISDWWHGYFLPIVLNELYDLPEPYQCVLKCHFIRRMEIQAVAAKAKLKNLEEVKDCLLTGIEMLTERVVSLGGSQTFTTDHIVSILTVIGLQKAHQKAKIVLNEVLFYPYLN